PEELELAAWRFMQGPLEVGIYHVDGTVGHATVTESYIYRGPDWPITSADGSEVVVKAGDWLLGAVLDEAAWEMAQKRQITGWSPQGKARRRTVTRRTA